MKLADDWLQDMERWKWRADYWSRRDEQIRLERERAELKRLSEFLDPNSPLVRHARKRVRAEHQEGDA